MKTGIIFDMDGTLWDSTHEVAQAWNQITEPKLGKRITGEDMRRTMGKTMDALVQALFPEYALSDLLPIVEECYLAENEYLAKHGAVLYPDVIQTIQSLAGKYSLYIVSNCQAGYIEAFLAHYRLEAYFADFVCFGDNGRQKSENIALIIERNRLTKGIYVGDIQADYEAAIAGGAEFIHAAYGFGTVLAAVPRLQTFAELPELLRQFVA